MRTTDDVEDGSQDDRQDKVQDDHREGDVHSREAEAAQGDDIDRLEAGLVEENRAEYFACCPADQQRPAIEPVGIQAQEDSGKGLESPDAPEHLQVDDLRGET